MRQPIKKKSYAREKMRQKFECQKISFRYYFSICFYLYHALKCSCHSSMSKTIRGSYIGREQSHFRQNILFISYDTVPLSRWWCTCRPGGIARTGHPALGQWWQLSDLRCRCNGTSFRRLGRKASKSWRQSDRSPQSLPPSSCRRTDAWGQARWSWEEACGL